MRGRHYDAVFHSQVLAPSLAYQATQTILLLPTESDMLMAMMRRKRVIQTWDLTKHYGNLVGVESLYFEVVEGESFGLLGVSGSGRTTILDLLLGLKHPTRGSAEVLGLDSYKQSYDIRRLVGCVLGRFSFYEGLRGGEFLDLCGRKRGVNGVRRPDLVDRLKIDEGRRIREYSRSEKQRLAWVQALMHDPDLIFVDDPSTDLDGSSKEAVYQLLEEERSRGKTLVLSTDSPADVVRLCDRAAIILDGTLRKTEDIRVLSRLLGRRVKVVFREDVDLEDFITPNMSVVSHCGREWVIAIRGEMGSLLKRLGRFSVEDITNLEGVVEEALAGMFRDQYPNPYL